MTTSPDVDIYLARSQGWPLEIAALRPILLGCGLDESIKWAKPCYSHEGRNIVIVQEMKAFLALMYRLHLRNIVIVQEMKAFLALMYFKGALLRDPDNVLEDQGPNSRSARRMCFRSVDDVTRLASTITAYVEEAIAVEDAGLQVDKVADLVLVDELQERLAADPALEAAFEALTPGRQREYNLYISDAKQAKTRVGRIDKCAPRILDGKGLRD